MSNKTQEQLTTLVRARYPLVWLETYEETRAIGLIEKVALDQKKHLAVWSITSGLCTIDGKLSVEGLDDPINVLKYIQENEKPMIVVLKDLHKFLPKEDVMVYRKLRDLYDSLKATSKTIFILSPIVKIPTELSKSITVVTLPLPDKEELETVLHGIIGGLEEVAKAGESGEEEAKAKTLLEHINEQLSKNGTKDTIISAGLGLTLNEYEDVLTKSLVQEHKFDVPVIISEKEQIIKKAGHLEFYGMDKLADMTEVGGLKALKTWIMKRKLAFTPKAQAFGLKTPKGVLLVGLPGTGKSLIAKTAAKYMQMPLLRLDMSEVASKWYGETTNKTKQALNLACAVSPVVFWWDEVEKMFGSTGQGTHEETMRAMSTILTWMQEVKEPVFIIATCNEPKSLNPALMRAGRFDEVFFVNLPDDVEREEIFRIHIKKAKRNPDKYKVKYFATLTDGYSGAEIEACIQDAMNDAFFEDSDLTDDHIAKSIASTIPLSKKRKADLDELREWGSVNALSASIEEQTEKISKRKAGRKFDL